MWSRALGIGRLRVARAIPLLAILLEVLWAYPWLVWLSSSEIVRWPGPPLSFGSAIALAVASETLTRFSLSRRWTQGRVRLVVLTGLALLLVVALRFEIGGGYDLWSLGWVQDARQQLSLLLGGLAFGAYLVWRGVSIGRESPSFDDLYRRFLIGLTALVVLLVLWGLTAGSDNLQRVLASAGLYVVVYFFAGLMAMALANLHAMREQIVRHDGVSGLLDRRWLSLLVGVVLTIMVVAVGVASVFSFDLIASLLRSASGLADLLLNVLVYATFPFAIAVAGLIYAIRFLISLVRRGQPPEPFVPPDLSELRRAAESREAQGLPAWVVLSLKWGLFVLVAALVVYILARAISRYWRGRGDEDIEEVSESLWSWDAFKGDLQSFLAWLLGRFRRGKAMAPATLLPPIAAALGQEEGRLFTICEIYQGLLWEGRVLGSPRRPSETPYEYRGKLASQAQGRASELYAITEAYVTERYGGYVTAPEQVAALNDMWHDLRLDLQKVTLENATSAAAQQS